MLITDDQASYECIISSNLQNHSHMEGDYGKAVAKCHVRYSNLLALGPRTIEAYLAFRPILGCCQFLATRWHF